MKLEYRTIDIIVTDDDKNICDFLKFFLKKEGHTVRSAQDGKACIKLALEKEPDVIFLDVDMPNFSGLETLAELRESQKTADIPVIMLTSHGNSEIIKRAIILGASEYLVKPIDKFVIRDRLTYFTSFVTVKTMRELLSKVSISDKSAFKGQGVSEYIRTHFDCYPIIIDEKKGSILVRTNFHPKQLKDGRDKEIEDTCILYLKSALHWIPIWPQRHFEVEEAEEEEIVEMEPTQVNTEEAENDKKEVVKDKEKSDVKDEASASEKKD